MMIERIRSLVSGRVLPAVVGLALVAGLVWQLLVLRQYHDDEEARSDAVAVAEAQVIDLTTMDTKTVEQKLDALASRTAGSFKEQLQGIATTFQEVIASSEIDASGKVVGSGVVEIDDDSAVVIVASKAEVASKGQKTREQTYRFLVALERSDDQWLINGMEFVG